MLADLAAHWRAAGRSHVKVAQGGDSVLDVGWL